MPSKREQMLAAVLAPLEGLVILRGGNPGEPDVTLNSRPELYCHRIEIEAF